MTMKWPWQQKNEPLSTDEKVRLVQAIRLAEAGTSGEIRLYIDQKCKADTAILRAEQVFVELKMHQTKQRNAVLIYLAMTDRKFAIYADEGALRATSSGYWHDLAAMLSVHFRDARFYEGLILVVNTIGARLAELFPPIEDDENELPDDIIFGNDKL